MFYNRPYGIYRGGNRSLPVVYNEIDEKDTHLDQDLQKIIRILPAKSKKINEVCYNLDDTCRYVGDITSFSMSGKGPRIMVPTNKEAQTIIRNFNKQININGETITDYIRYCWIDNINHGFSLWRIAKNIKTFDKERTIPIDLQRIPPETINIRRDVVHGWRVFEQDVSAMGWYKRPEDFLNKNVAKEIRGYQSLRIPDDQRVVLFTSLFRSPPMNTVVPYVILKYWILQFIRKFSEKMWAPLILAYVGDKDHYPEHKHDMSDAVSATNVILSKLKNFSVATFPGNTRVDVKELANNGDTYIKFMDKMDEHIIRGLYSSISTIEGNTVYKGNTEPVEQQIKALEGFREKIENDLKRFYVLNLVDVDPDEIIFIWPELRISTMDSLVRALEIAVKSGVFKDTYERRRAFSQIIPFLADNDLTPEEAERLEREFITMLAPSQPGETTANVVNKTQSSNNTGNDKPIK